MKTIWKYKVPIEGEFTLQLPKHHKTLCFQMQHNVPHIWVLVDPDSPVESFGFKVIGTGNPISRWFGNYIGTIQQFDGQLVWHLFED